MDFDSGPVTLQEVAVNAKMAIIANRIISADPSPRAPRDCCVDRIGNLRIRRLVLLSDNYYIIAGALEKHR